MRTLAREPALAESSCRLRSSAAPLPGWLAARAAPFLCSGVCRAVPPGSCAMTRSSNRLAATAAAVGGRNGAVALAPRVQAAAPTALGADLATRSTDEDDAGWVEEQYAWDSGVMVRRGAARRSFTVRVRARTRCAALAAISTHARALRSQIGARLVQPVDAASPMVPVQCAKEVALSERSPSPPVASDDGSKDPSTAHARVCQARPLAQPHRACATRLGLACVAHLALACSHVPTYMVYALACTGPFDPARARALRLAPPRPPGVRLRRGAWPGRPRQAVPRVCYAPGGCSRAA